MVMFRAKVHYRHGKRLKKHSLKWVGILVALLSITLGVYLLVLLRAPTIKPLSDAKQKQFIPGDIADKRIIIPKIAVKADIFEGDQTSLDKGVWHRLPELGMPETGGNFILSAHRYVLSPSTGRTKQQSYFYNIDKLALGDTILIDWHQKRYTYKITKIYTVKPTQLEVESPSSEPKLTMYSCTLGGSADGRVVIEAKPEKN